MPRKRRPGRPRGRPLAQSERLVGKTVRLPPSMWRELALAAIAESRPDAIVTLSEMIRRRLTGA